MCFKTRLYKNLPGPATQIEQKQVGSPVAEHNRQKETAEEKRKIEKSYSSLFTVCAPVSGWEQKDP